MTKPSDTRKVAIIADDEDLGRMLLSSTATTFGLEPLAFADGAAAVQAALAHDNVAVVLLDVDMPHMDGHSVCRRLRAEPRFASVPIVMVTGHEDSEAISRAFEAGATDFVSKPVNWALLPRRLAYILRNAAAAERIERLAYFDVLTGLPNRQRCLDNAALLFAQAAADEAVAVIYMDLNSFKKVNDTFGHAVGDAVLKDVAAKLTGALMAEPSRPGGFSIARFGGDEFVVLLKDRDARALAIEIAKACHATLESPITHAGLEFYSTPSIGVALYPEDGTDVATVFKHADTAMYQAKAGAAGSVVMYTAAMSTRMRDWLELDSRLRRAVHDGVLTLVYQPKFRLADNRMVGVEALLRWCDTEYGDIPPVRFIEIAEDSGLIIELGAWVIRAACRQLRLWLDRGIRLPVAVNVSGKELLHGDPARVVETEAAAAGVPTSLIEIEITESLLIKDSATVRGALERLRRLGCRIALDDFGTGYSSLAYITRFPPDRIKIDKAFVNNLDRSASDAAVANAILSLGESLGVIVTAEGVERVGQLEWLRKRGCHEVQGFIMATPLRAAELERRYFDADRADADTSRQRLPRTDTGA